MVSWLMTIKAVLISSGVALFLKVSVPVAVDLAPMLWISLISWLKPPYLYVITNGIIITIVASSKYYRSSGHRDEEDDGIVYGGEYKIQPETIVDDQASPRILVVKDLDPDFVVANPPPQEPEVVTAVVYDDAVDIAEDEIESEIKSVIMVESSDLVESGVDDEVLPPVISNRNLPMIESENLPPTEKPLVSSRFSHRKSGKASPEGGRALRVTKAKRNNDTLENTWKMITEGKSTPLTRQLYRRSDTFGRGDSGGSEAKPVMRKEPSLSQDELNRRVEEFIKKINEEMKLQRLESLRQYKEITSRGV
ncbi:unnamed protein product [Arabis nemorensis]|uniref:DUF4408 domain-containing protein n=1 Tax=Arabis nemorensis TaxID=586526 RepID=A0A565AWT5_9BRAS|nr:unnamed protein product [Arabis nemorensis]